jgi:hypothetical protein
MVATLTAPIDMKVCVSIAKWFPRGLDGQHLTVNKVYEECRFTSTNFVGRDTLTQALKGVYSKGNFDNLVKLALLCSMWSGEHVTVNDLLVITDD